MDASTTLTPLSSTRDAPFMIQMDDASSSSSSSTSNTSDSSAFAYKLRTKALRSVPENRSVRGESTQSTQSLQQCAYLGDDSKAPPPQQSTAKGEWDASFVGCLDCRECSGSDCLVLACCPCIPAARVHGMLGSSFESGVMYFGGLVFGLLISLGLCFSNTASAMETTSTGGAVGVSNTTSITIAAADVTPPASSLSVYGNLALVLLVLFLVGVAYLRTRVRHRFNVPGYRAIDCLLSFACCWCVLAQTQGHLEKHQRRECGLDTPADTLPAFV